MEHIINGSSSIRLYCEDSLKLYDCWETPITIISDGPYGINGYAGDLKSPVGLDEWYEPHISEWSKKATPQTTLWFWNTELGWATVHPILEKYNWEFKSCNIWDKGLSHIAGNVNLKTISHIPIVSEVCVQYVKKPVFIWNNRTVSMKQWLRLEWERTGLPFSQTNKACNVVDAATRKYFTKCHLWYMPPSDMFEKIVNYANEFGNPDNRPYFSIDGVHPLTKTDWDKMRPKFHCPFGVTNIWKTNQLRDKERVKTGQKAVHLNQKPLELINRIVEMSTDVGDVVWDPFGGLFTTAISCYNLHRKCFSSEINKSVFDKAIYRTDYILNNNLFNSSLNTNAEVEPDKI